MFNAVKKVRSLATSVVRPNGLILTIFLILSLIADGAAQSSSQTASAVSQAASAASQVASAASRASLQASSQAGSQSPSQTLTQTDPQVTNSALPSTAEPTSSYADSCKTSHRDMINNDYKDVVELAQITIDSKIPFEEEPGFWGLWGSAENKTAVKSVFPLMQQVKWPPSAECNLDGSAPCDGPTVIGGIAMIKTGSQKRDGTQGQQPKLVFCKEYFALPPLDHRVQMSINSRDLRDRYNLGVLHENRATTLFRTLLHYIPQSDDLKWSITDLWIYAWQKNDIGNIKRWSACYGVFCAKVLARINDGIHDWAAVNADNYALFALSKYVAQTIRGNFTFLPQLAWEGFGYSEIVVPFSADDGASILLNEVFSQRNYSQPNYDASRLQPDKSVHIENLLDPNQKADITSMPYVKTKPDNSGTRRETLSAITFAEAWKDQLINIDTSYNLTCFGEDPSSHPSAKDFDGEEAVDFAQEFCKDILKSADEKTPIPPSVRDTSDFRNASRVYTLKKTNAESHLGFFAVADPASFIEARHTWRFFEGNTEEARIDHCRLTYKDIIRNCDTDVTKRRGGVLKLNDRLYGVYTTPDDREGNLPWLTDYTALGDLQCANYNDTSYWHMGTSIEGIREEKAPAIGMTETDKLDDLCSCWYSAYPFPSSLFCKGSASKCEDLAADDKRKAALWDDFACSL